MRASFLMVGALVALTRGVEAQGPWGNVKSWTGSVTIEVVDIRKGEAMSSEMKYRATGGFTISDDMLPDGSHVMWPMPGAEAMSDPQKMAAATDAWLSHVVATFHATVPNESGGAPATVTCAADNKAATQVGVVINPTEPTYVVQVTAPKPLFKCTDPTHGISPPVSIQPPTFKLTGTRGAPGAVSGTQTFTVGTSVIKVTYNMAPSKKS